MWFVTARSHGIPSVLVDVLADPPQPEVARQRAFGMVVSTLAHGLVDVPPPPSAPPPAPRRGRPAHHGWAAR